MKELIGYIPWYFNFPDADMKRAFVLSDTGGEFSGKIRACGPRTDPIPDLHMRYPHECLWNGPAWPFATTQALVALANLLQNYSQEFVSKTDYYRILKSYSKSQHRITEEGKRIP